MLPEMFQLSLGTVEYFGSPQSSWARSPISLRKKASPPTRPETLKVLEDLGILGNTGDTGTQGAHG